MEKTQLNHIDTNLKSLKNIGSLIRLVEVLRGEGGCPWDRTQTPRSISVYLVEEMYELVEAIESDDPDKICEELGDVLFHIFFIASVFHEKGYFNIGDVAGLNTEKMTRRHPHVFDNKKVENAEDVKKQWHKIKMKEKNHAGNESLLDSVPSRLPPLMRAYRISERAAVAGFDWDNISGVMKKAEEEWIEFHDALSKGEKDKISMEFGDILFTLVNVARFARIRPEASLTDSTKKFQKRFKFMERTLLDMGKSLESAGRDELDSLWEEAKKKVLI